METLFGKTRAVVLAAGLLVPFHGAQALTSKMLVDNEKFTIARVTFAAGERQEKLHPPPGGGQIVTLVGAAEMEVDLDDAGKASSEKGPMEAGKTWWLSKTTLHRYGNLGKEPVDVIVVTFKEPK